MNTSNLIATATVLTLAGAQAVLAQNSVDLSGFEDTGQNFIDQLREPGIIRTVLGLIFVIIGLVAIFTKFIDWKWIGFSMIGLFFIYGTDNLVDPLINIFKA